MPWIEKWRDRRRRARVARLRREVTSYEELLQRLHPDYDYDQIRTTSVNLTAARRELADLTTNRKDS